MIEAGLGKKNERGSFGNSNQGTLFPFDPNTVSKEELIKLGFKEKTAQTFVKYRSKGFVFKQKNDVQKIFGVSEALYAQIEPYILIGNKKDASTTLRRVQGSGSATNVNKTLELNTADSLSLIGLKGIGPGYAKRILKYRSLLGGFVDIAQVKEIYGMTDELYQLIASQCTVNTAAIKKININAVDFKTLNKHPYMDYELTKHIFNFKRTTSITEANVAQLIEDDELLVKIKPYLEY